MSMDGDGEGRTLGIPTKVVVGAGGSLAYATIRVRRLTWVSDGSSSDTVAQPQTEGTFRVSV